MTNPYDTGSVTNELHAPAYDYELKLNPLTKALYYSAGADVQLLRYCPNYDRVKLQGIGGTVIATTILAFISGSYAFYTIFGPNSPGQDEPLNLVWFTVAILVGMVWAAVIYNLDRFIVATTGHGDGTDKITWSEFGRALPRILMACLIGLVISKPLEIRIMKTEIETVLARQQAALSDKYMEDAAKRRDGLIDVITKAKQEFEYEAGKNRLQPEIDELQMRIKEKNIDADKAQKEYRDAEPMAKRQGEQLNGLIKRIDIAHEVSPSASIFLTLMLIFIEVAPLIFKMMISLSPIDYLTENQKRLTLVRRGIQISHELGADGKLIQDVKKATYHQVEFEEQQVVGKIKIDLELTDAVQQKFKNEVVADIDRNPSQYIERIKPTDPPTT